MVEKLIHRPLPFPGDWFRRAPQHELLVGLTREFGIAVATEQTILSTESPSITLTCVDACVMLWLVRQFAHASLLPAGVDLTDDQCHKVVAAYEAQSWKDYRSVQGMPVGNEVKYTPRSGGNIPLLGSFDGGATRAYDPSSGRHDVALPTPFTSDD